MKSPPHATAQERLDALYRAQGAVDELSATVDLGGRRPTDWARRPQGPRDHDTLG